MNMEVIMMALPRGVDSTQITDRQEKDTESLAFYLSEMPVDAEYLMKMMVAAYTDGLHQGYKMSPEKTAEV